MSAGMTALLFTAAAIPIVWWSAVYLLPRLTDRDDTMPVGAVMSADILIRVATEGSLRTDSFQLEPSHRAPTDPYTPEQAHKAMQWHRECGTDICAAKHSALYTLVDAGLTVPDVRVVR
jgi:hypothetical protein